MRQNGVYYMLGGATRVPMSADLYGSELQAVVDALLRAGFTASVRGDDPARFVYTEHRARAVELSRDGTDFFAELFEEPHEPPLHEQRLGTPALAADYAVAWLSGDTRTA